MDSLLQHVLILLAASVGVVALFRRLKLPPIVGYLCIGLLLGPSGAEWITPSDDIYFFAEFGIVFLLFTIGLEFSIPRLIGMRNVVLGLGGAQLLVTALIVGAIAQAFGMAAIPAYAIGGVLALSSTAIVIKQLVEQRELTMRHGRLAVGILLLQDLAVAPLLIVISSLGAADKPIAENILVALTTAAVVCVGMIMAGRLFLRPLLNEVATARSPELFTLTVLLTSLAAAWLTHLAGLSLALGAFLAGAMFSETDYRHQVESDIRPFQDVLLGLFFITIGALVDLQTFPAIWYWVLLLTITMILLKIAIVTALCHIAGHCLVVASRTGIVLAQGSEFGFALIALSLSKGIIAPHVAQVILATLLLSMAISPLLIHYNGRLAKTTWARFNRHRREETEETVRNEAEQLHQHVIICGCGHIGCNIARFLEREQIAYIALDSDPTRVREARSQGFHVTLGDPSHLHILEAVGIERARLLAVTFDDVHAAGKIVGQARKIRPDLPVLARAADGMDVQTLLAAGATEVIPESLEASLILGSHALLLLDVPMSKVIRRMHELHREHYLQSNSKTLRDKDTALPRPSIEEETNVCLIDHTSRQSWAIVATIRSRGKKNPTL